MRLHSHSGRTYIDIDRYRSRAIARADRKASGAWRSSCGSRLELRARVDRFKSIGARVHVACVHAYEPRVHHDGRPAGRSSLWHAGAIMVNALWPGPSCIMISWHHHDAHAVPWPLACIGHDGAGPYAHPCRRRQPYALTTRAVHVRDTLSNDSTRAKARPGAHDPFSQHHCFKTTRHSHETWSFTIQSHGWRRVGTPVMPKQLHLRCRLPSSLSAVGALPRPVRPHTAARDAVVLGDGGR